VQRRHERAPHVGACAVREQDGGRLPRPPRPEGSATTADTAPPSGIAMRRRRVASFTLARLIADATRPRPSLDLREALR
jgi:hypothetical protein